jgi:16S rRNA (cytosine1402-N4)-methyltransferase
LSAESLSCDGYAHVPVLAGPLLAALADLPASGGLLIDCTLGGGGHSSLVLEAHPQLRLVGLDQDPAARAAAAERLAPFGERASIVACNFADYCPSEPAIAVVADLGVSSPSST